MKVILQCNIESKIPGNQELSGSRLIEHTLIYRQTESKAADIFTVLKFLITKNLGRFKLKASQRLQKTALIYNHGKCAVQSSTRRCGS